VADGLSPIGRSALHDVLLAQVERGDVPGLAAVVARGPDVHFEALGTLGFESDVPVAGDSIFRIASITKPIAAAAAMALVEDGTLVLDDPVDGLLPELADRRVLRSIDAALDDTVAAHRPITVRDVLTFRLGFGLVLVAPDTYPIQRAEAALGLRTLGPPWPPPAYTPDSWLAAFATLPLIAQPGTTWLYNTGAQVLCVLIERAAGEPLEQVLRRRVFAPLGMVDTGFSVPADALGRLTVAYTTDPQSGRLSVFDHPADSMWSTPPSFPNATGWLVSTIDDLWAFVRGLCAGDVIAPATLAAMTADELTPAQRAGAVPFLEEGDGWGLGLAVPAADGPAHERRPGFGWDGGTGTTWRTDPATGLTGILLTQRSMTSPVMPAHFAEFWRAARACIASDES
jgi:CubicO group peptidase (beta-lactamase class C family)